jgi:hypothetical protein
MVRSSVFLVSLSAAGVLLSIGVAQDAPKPQFTARELYYAVAKPPSQPAPAQQQTPKPAPKPTVAKSNSTPPKPVEVATTSTSTSTSQQSTTSSSTTQRQSQSAELPGGGHIIAASTSPTTAPAPTEGPALGLKYTILKQIGSDYVEVPPDTVFHANDHIRFNVESNSPGYLYIAGLGSSGNWRPMFPASDIENGSNHIEGFRSYTMPPNKRITFDELVGEEKVFIALCREPEPDLEKMIYSLHDGGKSGSQPTQPYTPASAPHPSNPPLYKPDGSTHQTLMASASIDNQTIGRLRETYSRDLIVETITDQTPGDRKENAVYVVNPTGSKDSRVVADIRMVHQ